MRRSLGNTALPYLLLLVVLIALISWSDRFAEQVSNEPLRVQVQQISGAGGEAMLWQFETETALVGDETFREDSLYRSAVEAYKSLQYRLAEDYFNALLVRYPSRPEILNYLGLTALNLNELSAANRWFGQALASDTGYTPAWINAGLLAARLENFGRADSMYARAIALAPVQVKPYLNKGIMHCRIGEWGTAVDALNGAVERASGDQKAKALTYRGMAHFNRGDTLLARNDFDAAINQSPAYLTPRVYLGLTAGSAIQREAELRKVIALQPNHAPAHYYLGVALQESGRSQEAQESYERALQLNPGDRDLSELLGSFYIENDLLERAERYFELVYRQDTVSPQNFFYRAKMASRDPEQIETAKSLYQRAIERSGGSYAEAYLNLGILRKRSGDIPGAIAAYQEATRIREEYEEAWYNMALAHRSTGSDAAAAACYETAIAINPSATKAKYNLAFVQRDLGDEAGARALWSQIIAQDPSYTKAWYNLGLSHLKSANHAEAIAVYRRMLDRFPGHAKGWFNLGRALDKSDRTAEAIQAYEQAINLDPSYVAAWKNLGNLNAQEGAIDAAINQYEQAIDLDHGDAGLRFNLALQYEKQEQPAQALIHLNKAVQLRPDYLKALEKMESIARASGDVSSQLVAAQHLTDLNPDPERTYDLARAYHKADRFAAAITQYDLSVQRGKTGIWPLYWRGKAQEESGELSAAEQAYRAALNETPDHKYSLYRLGLLLESRNAAEAQRLFDRIKRLYPDFAREKNIP